jgi:hypothetical protein
MLINPEVEAFSLGWHRDDVKPQAEEAEERARLAITSYGVSGVSPHRINVLIASLRYL